MVRAPKNDGVPVKLDVTSADSSSPPVSPPRPPAKPDLKGDRLNLLLLILLYTIQGVPFGFTVTALPIIMQSKKVVSYEDQALFSLVLWPTNMKLFWAPLVDSIYVQCIGRRKSWLIPVQYLMGAILLFSASYINDWLPEAGKPNLMVLTFVFFGLNFLAATQNIVIDGWALTMLKKSNVGYSSACSSSGFAIGIMLGSVVPVLLTSEDFCSKYLSRIITTSPGGVTTLERYLFVWGILCIAITSLIGIFKKEKDNRLEENHIQLTIVQNYKLVWDILKLPSIRVLIIALITMKVGFSAMRSSLAYLKLVDVGVPKDDIMVLTSAMFAVKILTPIVVSKYTSGTKPMSVCMNVIPIRLLWGFAYVLLIYITPFLIKRDDGTINIPMYYYLILGLITAINEALLYIMSVAAAAFFFRISDSRFGGTYMTLLNTASNLGMVWSASFGLKVMDFLTFSKCSSDPQNNNCSTVDLKSMCGKNGGDCVTVVDGYYVEIVLSAVIGFAWYFVFKNKLIKFQTESSSRWLVYSSKSGTDNVKASSSVD
ncbi:Major facilitator superfamily domain,Acetyl-coenzyme A transporter 1 [Cinara cedri]|uniref:Major facilitator superfamily domain,Acetyl-coenzyme A transporter 1 n=1 Tax=Cinara cedri TaxID=506608 RepID=A0A5E4M9Y7_9HEMI|nr:Major facilitator superfamily domain,Acetyl-coenzyme A transporter 1 [Cinara cedri]